MTPKPRFRTNGRLCRYLTENMPAQFLKPAWQTGAGELSVPAVAHTLGMSSEAVYKWLRADRIPAKGAKALIEISEGRLTPQGFLEFLV